MLNGEMFHEMLESQFKPAVFDGHLVFHVEQVKRFEGK